MVIKLSCLILGCFFKNLNNGSKICTRLLGLCYSNPMFAISSLLIVEDDVSCRLTLQSYLGALCDTETAKNLGEARQRLAQRQFELVLLDKGLPDGSGLSIIEHIRAVQDNALVVIMTGDSDFGAVNKCLAAGADDYVIKSEHLIQDLMIRIPVLKKRMDQLRKETMPLSLLPTGLEQVSKERFQNAMNWMEKHYIQSALELCDFSTSDLAERLDCGRTTIFNKIKELQIDRPKLRKTTNSSDQEASIA